MRFSLLTRVSFAFCLVVVSSAALLWTHIAMQKRIMARFEETQVTDLTSLRELTDATQVVVSYRQDLLKEQTRDLIRSLRLAARFAPAQNQLRSDLQNVAGREPTHERFVERRTHQKGLQRKLHEALDLLDRLPEQNQALLQQLDAPEPTEHLVQQKLGAILVTLDNIETRIRAIHRTINVRYQASSERLSRDQRRASNMTTALLILAFIAFLIAIGTIWRALAPIGRLTAATTRVGRGEFDIERIRAGRDEIGQLAEAFYDMTQALASRDRALTTAHEQREDAYDQLVREEQARIQAERLAVVGALSARITHELRNPLSSLSLNVEMILEDPALASLDADSRDMLMAIKGEIERLESLSTGYLTLARTPIGAHAPLRFAKLVHDTVAQFQRSVERDKIRIEQVLDHDAWVDGDENELRSLLVNLIENARIALEAQTGPRRIRISARAEHDTLLCEIEDNGAGVSGQMREHLFDAFRTDRPRGTGLGLSTARRTAESHGGSLTYDDSPLGGACFLLRLPLAAEPKSAKPAVESTDQASGRHAGHQKCVDERGL